ncbi:hypothetical protein GGR26_001722 [Lewinella marina]|uniref:Glycoside hydrolase family 127 protein n=1 Tax=Neolewinella marina TaxID=438751 RepID=A0A2G0CDP3_9BACT|nr:glycoside hydrolase family 127 protein [Neolewinella marina]NJB85954.1 hypothetical protein [Neolewinella marina]PHK98075.1 hypothetical protein CGL56_12860 [Neolewinella marina]
MRSLILPLLLSLCTLPAAAQEGGILNLSQSTHVTFRNVDIGDCQWTDGFWADKVAVAEHTMIPHMGTLLKGDVGHALNNFKIAAGLMEGEAGGTWWHDGDFYKWMEAVVYLYALNHDERLLEELDGIIDIIARAQQPDGYLSTHTQIKDTPRYSLINHHEMYNSGHLLTAASIHHRVTGQTNFLDIATRHADFLYGKFQPTPDSLKSFGFNPSQIMGLVELYRTVHDRRYLELAQTFVDNRGYQVEGREEVMPDDPTVPVFFRGDQHQNRTPLRDETEAVGHAVLGMYLWSGAADVYAETGEQAILDALERIWDSATNRKMYVTGALGQTHYGASMKFDLVHEGFIEDYMMPNATAYNETCANISNAMFNWRMLGLKGEAKYADVIERVLYNSALSGISLEGKDYFYANPLRMNKGVRDYSGTESACREPYIDCFCCPPNLVRTIAKSSGWAYSLSDNGLAVNLYGGNRLDTELTDGSAIRLTQETNYPWDSHVRLTVHESKADPFALLLRIPGWAEGATIRVNGQPLDQPATPGSYATVERAWKAGDVVELELPMEVSLVEGHPLIEEVRNQVAVTRGPVVYCMESPDLPEDVQILDVYLPGNQPFAAVHEPDFLGGVTTIRANVLLRNDEEEGMYRKVSKPAFTTYPTRFIPYFAWSNRGTAEMTVFLPVLWDASR